MASGLAAASGGAANTIRRPQAEIEQARGGIAFLFFSLTQRHIRS
jgi:hypothetical protein